MAEGGFLMYGARMLKVFYRNYLIFTAVLLLCVGSLGYIVVNGDAQIENSDDWILHSHEVIVEAEELNALIVSMIASQRGFLITGKESFQQEYDDTRSAISRRIASLSELTTDNPSQQSRLQEMRQYFLSFAENLNDRTARSLVDTPQKVLQDVEGVNRMKTDLLRLNADFLNEEYEILSQRINIVRERKDEYLLTLIVGGTVAVILLLMFNAYILRVQAKRTAAETALLESEEVFRMAIEGTQDGVFDWNIKTDEIFYSDQYIEMLGYTREDFPSSREASLKLLHPDEHEKVQEYVDLYMSGQLSEYSNTFRMQHKSGRWVWIHSRAKLIRDKKGAPARMIGAHMDISASKEYEIRLQEAKAKAEEANRAKSDFLAHMSHEIRTPLTTISGTAEILAQNMEELDEKKQNLIRVLNSSSIALKDLISDVLDFSKIESGELALEETPFGLQDAFQHIVSVMSVRTAEKGLDFVFDYEEVKDVRFYGDPIRLRQILINLIGNALKFTEKGYVRVIASRQTEAHTPVLRIDVKDSGIGIPEEHKETIFERFKQGDSSVSRKYGGTGLGLPISQKLASLMGGDILVESTQGKGSTFSLILPLREVEGAAESEQIYDEALKNKINDKLKAAISNTNKILLVEDYEGNVVVLSYILEEMDFAYDVANTGLEALNLWKDNYYNLILMDIQMPEMDGFTATAQIRHMEEEQGIERTPIIGMTAHALVGDKDKCIEAGMDAYLPKPVVEVDLKATMLKFLKEKQKAA